MRVVQGATCDRCTLSFEYAPVLIDGREVARRTRCDACCQQDKDLILKANRLQAGHVSKLEATDRETAIRKLLQDAGANAWEHGAATLESFDVGEAGYRPVGMVREFASAVANATAYEPVRGLYLWGETGTGKTHLSVAALRLLLEFDFDPRRVLFDQAAELIARIQDTYGRKDASTFDVLEQRFNAGLWVLDDFGTERTSDDVVRHLTLIFARRAMRPTLITSNLSPDEVQKQRPELMRVLSRLGPKYFRVCEVKGRDRRFD